MGPGAECAGLRLAARLRERASPLNANPATGTPLPADRATPLYRGVCGGSGMHTTAPDFGADCGKAIGFGAIRDACQLNGPVDKPIVVAIVTHHTFSRLARFIV